MRAISLRKSLPLVALVFALLCTSGFARAEDLPRTPREYLQRMDTDHDGRVSRDEYVNYMMRTFDRLDVDHNGVLEGDELPPGAKPVTRAQYRRNLEATFARMDRNHDGYLDAHELAQPPR
ncbi:MAG: EF-hand domain-containing protein [Proteobacteria bacterium]|nr:EF-hand domain-containing protein [Pseudomonadota bacterium]